MIAGLLIAVIGAGPVYSDRYECVTRVTFHLHTRFKPTEFGEHTHEYRRMLIERRDYWGRLSTEEITVEGDFPLLERKGPYRRFVYYRHRSYYLAPVRIKTRAVRYLETSRQQ